jgi:hypothetical protein
MITVEGALLARVYTPVYLINRFLYPFPLIHLDHCLMSTLSEPSFDCLNKGALLWSETLPTHLLGSELKIGSGTEDGYSVKLIECPESIEPNPEGFH